MMGPLAESQFKRCLFSTASNLTAVSASYNYISSYLLYCGLWGFKGYPHPQQTYMPRPRFQTSTGQKFLICVATIYVCELVSNTYQYSIYSQLFPKQILIPFSFWPVVCCVKQWCNSSCLPNLWLKRNHSRPRSFDSGKTELQTGEQNQYLGIWNFRLLAKKSTISSTA